MRRSGYIVPLLFFKRISDVYHEKYQSALAESAGNEEYARFLQRYRFQAPAGHHWRVRLFHFAATLRAMA